MPLARPCGCRSAARPSTATTDAMGRAEFNSLAVGQEARATATVDGESARVPAVHRAVERRIARHPGGGHRRRRRAPGAGGGRGGRCAGGQGSGGLRRQQPRADAVRPTTRCRSTTSSRSSTTRARGWTSARPSSWICRRAPAASPRSRARRKSATVNGNRLTITGPVRRRAPRRCRSPSARTTAAAPGRWSSAGRRRSSR